MRPRLVALSFVVLLVGAVAAAVPFVEHYAGERLKKEVERDGATQVESVEIGLFDRSIVFNNIRSTRVGKMSAQRFSLSGLWWPLSELVAGRTPLSGWRPGDPLQVGRVVVVDLRFEDPLSQSWRIESAVLEGLDLARFEAAIDPGPSSATILGARLLKAMTLKRLQETNVSYTRPGVAQPIAISDLAIENIAAGKFAGFNISGIEAAGAKPDEPLFRLDRVKIAGLDLGRVLASLSQSDWRPGMPLGRIDLEAANATGFGGEAMARYGITLGSVSTETSHEAGGIVRVKSRVDGFVLAPPVRGMTGLQMRVMLTAMGLKELRLGLDCTATEDRGKGEVSIDRCALAGTDLGDIEFSAKFQGADQPFWTAVDSGNMAELFRSSVALGSAKLVLADKSALERWFRALAISTGQQAQAVRQTMAQEVRQYQPAGVLISEQMTKMLDTAARFVENGGTLTIELKPDPPLGMDKLGRLKMPGPDLIEMLGAEATLAPPR